MMRQGLYSLVLPAMAGATLPAIVDPVMMVIGPRVQLVRDGIQRVVFGKGNEKSPGGSDSSQGWEGGQNLVMSQPNNFDGVEAGGRSARIYSREWI